MIELNCVVNRIQLPKEKSKFSFIRETHVDSTLLIAVLVGTITIYVLEFVWHMALPFHQKTFKELNDQNSVLDDLSINGDGSGMYFLPNYHSQIRESTSDDEKKELMLKQQEAMQGGPVVFVAYSKKWHWWFWKRTTDSAHLRWTCNVDCRVPDYAVRWGRLWP